MMSFLIKSLSLFDRLKKSANQGICSDPSAGKDCQAAQRYHRAPCEPYGMALMELIPTYSACVTRIRILLPHWKAISQTQGEGKLGGAQHRVFYPVAHTLSVAAAVPRSSGHRFMQEGRSFPRASQPNSFGCTNLQHSKAGPFSSCEWAALWITNPTWLLLAQLFPHPALHLHPSLSARKNKRCSSAERLPFKSRCCQALGTADCLSATCAFFRAIKTCSGL